MSNTICTRKEKNTGIFIFWDLQNGINIIQFGQGRRTSIDQFGVDIVDVGLWEDDGSAGGRRFRLEVVRVQRRPVGTGELVAIDARPQRLSQPVEGAFVDLVLVTRALIMDVFVRHRVHQSRGFLIG